MHETRFAGVIGFRIFAVVVLLWALPLTGRAESPADTSAHEDFFESEVRPLLLSQCSDCHGAEEQSGGLRIDSLASLLSGGDTGPAIVPGDVESSLLIQAIRQTGELRMPPDSRLNEDQVKVLERWISLGAPWPVGGRGSASESQHDAAEAKRRSHWAFQPVGNPPLPLLSDYSWCRNPIDFFVLAALESKGMAPSPRADRRTLIRRVYYDLVGLPPSKEEVDQFVSDPGGDLDIYRSLCERLLDSPQYGVQWGRRWLDVARYSDTKGYVPGAEDRYFVQSAAYRDWVVNAFNQDMPYDRFLLLQIAADQIAPDDPASLAAMGFLTVGRRFQGVAHDIIDDRIDVLSRGTMGLTAACARCHDHKYDPIPTSDYYSLYGVFMNCMERQVQVSSPRVDGEYLPALEAELHKRIEKRDSVLATEIAAANQRVRSRVTDYLLTQLELHKYPEEGFGQVLGVNDIVPMFVRRWQAYLLETGKRQDPVFLAWHRYARLPTEDFAQRAESVTRELSELPAGSLNRFVAAAFEEPPESMREVAERYGQMLGDIDRDWTQIVATAKEKSAEPPNSLDSIAVGVVRTGIAVSGARGADRQRGVLF